MIVKTFFTIAFTTLVLSGFAQQDNAYLKATVTAFHDALVIADTNVLKELTDNSLSYGHSNGWVQTRREVLDDLKSGKLTYERYEEDSVGVVINNTGTVASVRFVATIDANMQGTASTFKLKVLEVWLKREKNWVLFARQAVKR